MADSSLAGNPDIARRVQEQASYLTQKGWYHSIELPDGSVIPGLIGVEQLKERFAKYPIPADLTGKRALDIGAWTGWCSFELERRGAQVVAVDCMDLEEFRAAHKLLGSKVDYRVLDADELSPELLGTFDIVVFFGVLYHLRNPLLALENICRLTTDMALVESYVTDATVPEGERSAKCLMEFYETNELGGQFDNWVGPNIACLLAMCRTAGFARVRLEGTSDVRAAVTCRRRWEAPPKDPTEEPPWIGSAVNNRTNDVYFHKNKDEYVCLYFKSKREGLRKEDLRVEIDGFGVPILDFVDHGGGGYQANFQRPAGLAEGMHEVRMRTAGSLYGNRFQIFVESVHVEPVKKRLAAAPSKAAPSIYNVESNITGNSRFRGYSKEYLCCYFTSEETYLEKEDLSIEVDGNDLPVLLLVQPLEGGWQICTRLPSGMAPGPKPVRIRTCDSPLSEPYGIVLESS